MSILDRSSLHAAQSHRLPRLPSPHCQHQAHTRKPPWDPTSSSNCANRGIISLPKRSSANPAPADRPRSHMRLYPVPIHAELVSGTFAGGLQSLFAPVITLSGNQDRARIICVYALRHAGSTALLPPGIKTLRGPGPATRWP